MLTLPNLAGSMMSAPAPAPAGLISDQPETKMKNRSLPRGFSLLELMIVLGIIMVISAIALPNVMSAYSQYRLNGAANQLSNLLQRARYEAIKNNTIIPCRMTVSNGITYFYIDLNGDSTMQNTEPQMNLPTDMEMSPANAPSTASMNLGTTVVPSGSISFDGRGIVNFGGAAASNYATTMGYIGNAGRGFKAVSVTQLGKMKVWGASQNGTWHSP